MRYLTLMAMLMTGACSGEGEQPKAAAAPKASAMQAGQWETSTEVTRLTQKDQGAPKIATPPGTKSTDRVCVGEGEVKKPAPALFAGSEGGECAYDNFYMSGGTLNVTMRCTRPGLNGEILVTAYGDYAADSFEVTTDTSTHLATDGDVVIAAKMTGRHVGPCTAAPEEKAA
jgi:hypothetical protein